MFSKFEYVCVYTFLKGRNKTKKTPKPTQAKPEDMTNWKEKLQLIIIPLKVIIITYGSSYVTGTELST